MLRSSGVESATTTESARQRRRRTHAAELDSDCQSMSAIELEARLGNVGSARPRRRVVPQPVRSTYGGASWYFRPLPFRFRKQTQSAIEIKSCSRFPWFDLLNKRNGFSYMPSQIIKVETLIAAKVAPVKVTPSLSISLAKLPTRRIVDRDHRDCLRSRKDERVQPHPNHVSSHGDQLRVSRRRGRG